jgi:hypothetical protein
MFQVRHAGIAVTLVSFLCCVGAARALELISSQEARLPDDPGGTPRGISLGPVIIVVNPPPASGFLRSPFSLKIRFESFGGARIDPDSILVTYKKVPPIDLTQRVRSFITPEQIQIDSVEVPAGEHRIQVYLKDTRGHTASTEFFIKVRE